MSEDRKSGKYLILHQQRDTQRDKSRSSKGCLFLVTLLDGSNGTKQIQNQINAIEIKNLKENIKAEIVKS